MSLVSIQSPAQWQGILTGTNVVIADFYADWCGPCKMIAPHFERLAKEYTKPSKVAFCKINVDQQSAIARAHGVSAMPTFIVFHAGQAVETIKGANPPALTQAIQNALKLPDKGGRSGASFTTPGRTLGGDQAPRASLKRPVSWQLSGLLGGLITFFGLYIVSLFAIDPHKAAEMSQFNRVNPPPPPMKSAKAGASGARQQPKAAGFKTLADLGGDE
ncbi:Thioredoxin [Colletotrichum sidae]|uniref:Thioredoxin n=3 Tax=Colletotrichum orbiculare species complex TaxID=2707354 RepID=N4VX39_COLOR|nr:Thioredoxin [Colletotrichum orbiculare MAFF 240422]TDZ74761.1 Thioredoxin [Colletotrichum trifolii]TEA13509.1 Thioredoxin [Colletotrichum sidae]